MRNSCTTCEHCKEYNIKKDTIFCEFKHDYIERKVEDCDLFAPVQGKRDMVSNEPCKSPEYGVVCYNTNCAFQKGNNCTHKQDNYNNLCLLKNTMVSQFSLLFDVKKDIILNGKLDRLPELNGIERDFTTDLCRLYGYMEMFNEKDKEEV